MRTFNNLGQARTSSSNTVHEIGHSTYALGSKKAEHECRRRETLQPWPTLPLHSAPSAITCKFSGRSNWGSGGGPGGVKPHPAPPAPVAAAAAAKHAGQPRRGRPSRPAPPTRLPTRRGGNIATKLSVFAQKSTATLRWSGIGFDIISMWLYSRRCQVIVT